MSLASFPLLFFGVSRVAEEVEAAVFSTAEEVWHAVSVEVRHARADIVSLDVLLRKRASVLENPVAVFLAHLLQKVRVGGVQEEVELAVTVPVRHTQLSAATAARDAGVQAEWFTGFVHKCAP